MNTPWGRADHLRTITTGVIEVSTPRHGGIAIAKGYAEKHLSEAAREKAIFQNSYYFFEEDCDWAIPMFELKELWEVYFKPSFKKDKEQYLLESLSGWNADYLIKIGVTPLAEQYQYYLQSFAVCKREAEKPC